MAGPNMILFTRTDKFSSLMLEEFVQMRDERSFTDFQILPKGKESLACHKLVLSAHSPVLKAMLLSDMSEAANKKVSLEHIALRIMTLILDYMCIGQITFQSDDLMDVTAAAHYLQIKELLEKCVAQVPTYLNPANAISWLQLGDELYLAEVKAKSAAMMVSSFPEISKQAAFLAMSAGYGNGTDEVEELSLEDGSWAVSTLKMPASLCTHHCMLLDLPQQD